MLKFMGANTSLSPLHAKDLLEVSVICILHSIGTFFLLFFLKTLLLLFQDEEVGFAYVSQREARTSLYENLTK